VKDGTQGQLSTVSIERVNNWPDGQAGRSAGAAVWGYSGVPPGGGGFCSLEGFRLRRVAACRELRVGEVAGAGVRARRVAAAGRFAAARVRSRRVPPWGRAAAAEGYARGGGCCRGEVRLRRGRLAREDWLRRVAAAGRSGAATVLRGGSACGEGCLRGVRLRRVSGAGRSASDEAAAAEGPSATEGCWRGGLLADGLLGRGGSAAGAGLERWGQGEGTAAAAAGGVWTKGLAPDFVGGLYYQF
jgi:hypothetical protein